MPTAAGQLRQFVFRISNDETTFARRGFAPGDPARQSRLEKIGRVFLDEIAGPHVSTAHVGVGRALSRIPKPLRVRQAITAAVVEAPAPRRLAS